MFLDPKYPQYRAVINKPTAGAQRQLRAFRGAKQWERRNYFKQTTQVVPLRLLSLNAVGVIAGIMVAPIRTEQRCPNRPGSEPSSALFGPRLAVQRGVK